MATVAWKLLFAERFREAFSLTSLARGDLAAVSDDLASPLRGGDEVRIKGCAEHLVEASKLLGFAVSALGTVELFALRSMKADDADEVLARPRARATDAYDVVAASRGHLGAMERLLAATVIATQSYGVDDERVAVLSHAVDVERVAVLAAIAAASRSLDGMEALRVSDEGLEDSRTPARAPAPAPVPTRSAAAAPVLVGDAMRSLLPGFVPAALLRVALSGAVPEMEAAQAALQVSANAMDKGSTVAAAADWCSCYDGALHALNAATAALSGILALHSQVAVFFVRCAPQLDLDRGGKGWRSSDSWAASRADVERHGRAALHRLWSASSCLEFCLVGALGGGSPSSSMQEAREVMGRAIADAREARDSGDHLRHAAAREFFHSSTVLHDAPST